MRRSDGAAVSNRQSWSCVGSPCGPKIAIKAQRPASGIWRATVRPWRSGCWDRSRSSARQARMCRYRVARCAGCLRCWRSRLVARSRRHAWSTRCGANGRCPVQTWCRSRCPNCDAYWPKLARPTASPHNRPATGSTSTAVMSTPCASKASSSRLAHFAATRRRSPNCSAVGSSSGVGLRSRGCPIRSGRTLCGLASTSCEGRRSTI